MKLIFFNVILLYYFKAVLNLDIKSKDLHALFPLYQWTAQVYHVKPRVNTRLHPRRPLFADLLVATVQLQDPSGSMEGSFSAPTFTEKNIEVESGCVLILRNVPNF